MLQQFPSFFQMRYGVPSPSTKWVASIEPPSSGWQTSGSSLVSTSGPPGLSPTASVMHWLASPLGLSRSGALAV
jgi:hypothetical protein